MAHPCVVFETHGRGGGSWDLSFMMYALAPGSSTKSEHNLSQPTPTSVHTNTSQNLAGDRNVHAEIATTLKPYRKLRQPKAGNPHARNTKPERTQGFPRPQESHCPWCCCRCCHCCRWSHLRCSGMLSCTTCNQAWGAFRRQIHLKV